MTAEALNTTIILRTPRGQCLDSRKSKALAAGNWYLLASCEYCHTRHVVEADPSKGTSPTEDFYRSECPGCLRIGFYAAGKIERYLHLSTHGMRTE